MLPRVAFKAGLLWALGQIIGMSFGSDSGLGHLVVVVIPVPCVWWPDQAGFKRAFGHFPLRKENFIIYVIELDCI